MSKITVGGQVRQGHGVVYRRFDPLRLQVFHELHAMGRADHIEMETVFGFGPDPGETYLRDILEITVVQPRVADTGFRPFQDMRQLGAEDRGLDGIQPAVDPFYAVIRLFQGAMVGEHPAFFSQLVAVGDDTAGVAIRAEVLSRIEAKGSRHARETRADPAKFRKMRLRTVFKQE